jgi:hypothetical protein
LRENWVLRKTISGVDLINNGAWGTSFVPNPTSDWSIASVSLPPAVAEPNVRFKFEYKSGYFGNNFYLDDVLISQYNVGINNISTDEVSLNIFPNPSNGNFLIAYTLPKDDKVNIIISDLTGRNVMSILNQSQSAGKHQPLVSSIDLGGLTTGIYMVRLEVGSRSYMKKTGHRIRLQQKRYYCPG